MQLKMNANVKEKLELDLLGNNKPFFKEKPSQKTIEKGEKIFENVICTNKVLKKENKITLDQKDIEECRKHAWPEGDTFSLHNTDRYETPIALINNLIKVMPTHLGFIDGRHYYPITFQGEKEKNIAFRTVWDKNVIVNPPFSDIKRHLMFLEKISERTGGIIGVITPIYKGAKDISSNLSSLRKRFHTWYLHNPISFLFGSKGIIREKSRTGGQAPQQTAIIWLGLKGVNIKLVNDKKTNIS